MSKYREVWREPAEHNQSAGTARRAGAVECPALFCAERNLWLRPAAEQTSSDEQRLLSAGICQEAEMPDLDES